MELICIHVGQNETMFFFIKFDYRRTIGSVRSFELFFRFSDSESIFPLLANAAWFATLFSYFNLQQNEIIYIKSNQKAAQRK